MVLSGFGLFVYEMLTGPVSLRFGFGSCKPKFGNLLFVKSTQSIFRIDFTLER
jgi:hypothetical protein